MMKQTEIGLIPIDWEIAKFTAVFNFLSTASYSRADLKENGEFGYIHYGDIHTKFHFHIDVENKLSGFITKEQLKTYSKIEKGDLIMADASEDYQGIGKAIEVLNVGENQYIISGLHTFLIRDKIKNTFALGFKGYFQNNPLIKKQYDALATGLKVFSLSKGSFKNIQIPIPPLPEQEAIAEALGDCDAWIVGIEHLLAKKRLIKQGAMQELLTPKEDWEVKKLGEVCLILNNLRIPIKESSRIKGEIPYYGANGVQGYVEGFTHNGEFVLIAEDGANDLNNYPINYVNGKIWVNNHAHVLQGIISILGTRFLSYLLKSVDFKSVLVGGTRAKLNKSILEKIEFSFPSLPEQTRIATILSDMDAELEALGKKLGKARMIKQGMMQELLTGRVRLV